MVSKYRQPIYLTPQGKELEAKQRAFRLKTLSEMTKNIAASYPSWLNVRIWKPEKIDNYVRAYVGSAEGYLVITPRGISEFDRQTRNGKATEILAIQVLPWQKKAYNAYKDELFETARDFISEMVDVEQEQWDKLATKLGYAQSASTSLDVLTGSDVFDLIDDGLDEPVRVDPNRAAMQAAKRGDVVTVGKSKWVVFADSTRVGGMLGLYKFGSKGAKMYRGYLDDGGMSVRQINGVADFVGPVVANGGLNLTGQTVRLS
jgi:hypothetical protein